MKLVKHFGRNSSMSCLICSSVHSVHCTLYSYRTNVHKLCSASSAKQLNNWSNHIGGPTHPLTDIGNGDMVYIYATAAAGGIIYSLNIFLRGLTILCIVRPCLRSQCQSVSACGVPPIMWSDQLLSCSAELAEQSLCTFVR